MIKVKTLEVKNKADWSKTNFWHIILLTIPFISCLGLHESHSQIDKLKLWISLDPEERPPMEQFEFSYEGLTEEEANEAIILLHEDKQARLQKEHDKEWGQRVIKSGSYQMPFFYRVFGEEPVDGRSLYISLHGGGGTTAEVNDQQYNNQKTLYNAIMSTLEGVYLAPRAPTNTWNLWHQSHVDALLNTLIQLSVVEENVNLNKVYILGYSAGGDGLYQLAPRMADRWAAASMMAGHPNDASPLSLRNTPFAIHMGELDEAFDRNLMAARWGELLDSLQAVDTEGYIHDVQIHQGLGHWMELEDAVALPWMSQYQRNPIPEKVVWKQDDVRHPSFYWLEVPQAKTQIGGVIRAAYDKVSNEINILENYSDEIKLLMNDEMFDLNVPVKIKYQDEIIYEGIPERTILNIYQSIETKGDLQLTFPSAISIADNQTVIDSKPADLIEFIILGSSSRDSLENGVTIYPNPANKVINVNWSTAGKRSIELVDLQGRVVKEIKTSSLKNTIDLSNHHDQAYLLRIYQNDEVVTYRFLIF